MIIDFHMHVGEDLAGERANLDDIKQQMQKNGIDKACVFPFNCPDPVAESIDLLKLDDSFIPFLRFDPNMITRQQLHMALKHPFKGVKLHARSQNFHPDDPAFTWIFEELREHKLPILIHTKDSIMEPMSDPRKVLTIARQFPDITFVLAHCAGGERWVWQEIASLPNVYVETSIFSLPLVFEYAYKRYGFDRFIYGSDYPYSYPEIELKKIELARIPSELKEKILYKNALKVLKMETVIEEEV
ncbi:MAG: hypothetical protein CMH61_00370 [Nanoarchaeota archaeon]|nr:hypothetical protein [Nanoarchaeota archaeon]|tara:strand:+ start:3098 stop:3829 length:732 start_codon:yes stop_codon:yes gene_type:complete